MAAQNYEVIILGAGAAGLFCAGTAALRGRRVLVLEHNAAPGAKILISGGGRCNFTNREVKAGHFLCENPHFAKSALARFTPDDFVALVEKAGIAYHEKVLGQLFCDGPARQILDMLLARASGAEIRLSCAVTQVTHDGRDFTVAFSQGVARAPALVVATGGLSIPKLGATGFAYALARQFRHEVVTPRPALVPLTFAGEDLAWMAELAGVSAPARVNAGKHIFAENVLFTHRGLSGPAILQISSYLRAVQKFTVDFCPGMRAEDILLAGKQRRAKAELKSVLTEFLPARLAAYFAGAEQKRMADLPDKALRALGVRLNHFEFTPAGNEGFAKAEVTAGGVDTEGLDSKTCGSKKVPGLYFIGEAVDVTGWLGGYNFQWAWASGHAAGTVV